MNNKSLFFAVIFLISIFTINTQEPSNSVQQYDNENDFVVETVGDSLVARITGYNGTKTEVRIPRQIRRMIVVAIGERAFYKKGFTSVTIPNNVILIGKGAFSGNEIAKITIGTNVTFHEDSFDAGFAGFYFENGCRAGTYILSGGSWNIQAVSEPFSDNKDILAKTPDNPKVFNILDIEPYFGFSVGIGLWDYGPSSLMPRIGLHIGLVNRSSDNFTIILAGEGGGFFGVSFPVFEDIGISYGFYFGSFLEFYFSDSFGFSLGGGMTKGYFRTKNDLGEDYFFPFAEFNIMLGDEEESLGVFFRYYFNDSDNFYNKFSVGIKSRLF